MSILGHVCVLAALLLGGQDKPPVPPVPGGRAEPVEKPKGPELVPGELPVDTSLAARTLMLRVTAATLPAASDAEPKPQRAPVTAFDLRLDVRYRASDAQSHDMPDARYRWLAPNFVRSDTGRGRSHLRGPEGAYYINSEDPKNPKATRLDLPDRETAEDRRQLEEVSGLAGNFARLVDPSRLRIARASTILTPVACLPEMLHKRAAELAWLEIESPDFAVMRMGKLTSPMARVELGIDPKSNLVEIAVVDDASSPPRVTESTAVLQLEKYKPLDGFVVPHHIQIWMPQIGEPNVPLSNVALRPQPAMDIYVLGATLRAKLTPQDFLPPK